MSQENVEIVRRMYEAFNRGDFAIAHEMLHPDAELHQQPEAPDADSYYGRNEWERGFAIWLSEWEHPFFQPLDIADFGAGVILRVRVSDHRFESGLGLGSKSYADRALHRAQRLRP